MREQGENVSRTKMFPHRHQKNLVFEFARGDVLGTESANDRLPSRTVL